MTEPPGREPSEFDRAQLVLEDARERARRIIDQSVAEAQEMLTRRMPDVGGDSVPRALSTLAEEMRDLRQRLDRIEGLLLRQEQHAARSAPAAQAPQPAPPPPLTPPPAQPAGDPPSQEAPPPVQPAGAPPPQEAPPPTPPESRPADAPSEAAAAGSNDRIMPDGGPLTVLVSPVAGFQGLMRVQEALVAIDAVSEAVVEGYAQGEARLRLQLREAVTPTALATGLSASLAQRAEIQPGEAGERTLRVALS